MTKQYQVILVYRVYIYIISSYNINTLFLLVKITISVCKIIISNGRMNPEADFFKCYAIIMFYQYILDTIYYNVRMLKYPFFNVLI